MKHYYFKNVTEAHYLNNLLILIKCLLLNEKQYFLSEAYPHDLYDNRSNA